LFRERLVTRHFLSRRIPEGTIRHRLPRGASIVAPERKHLVRNALSTLAMLACLAGCATAPPSGPPPAAEPAVAPLAAASAPEAAAPVPAPLSAASAAQSAAPVPEPAASEATATPSDPLRPGVFVDLDDRSARQDLWQRMRAGFALADIDDDYVRRHEQWYGSRPDYVQRMTDRGSRYLFHIVEEVERRGMPLELALLPFIESAFNPQAMSSAKASGMWQFMPGTGRAFELTQNVFQDERRSVLASTRAALDYLERLHGMFGDWHLALAAYNWGEGNVQRAIRRNEKKRLPTGYAHLRMPAETRNYVPKLQAVKNIVLRPGEFGLSLPRLDNHPYFLTVAIDRDIDVDLAAELADIDLESFHQLNPQLNKPVILAAGTPQILLPYDNANAFVRNLHDHVGPMASWTVWVAPKTMKPSEVAKKVGMPEDELREVNRIPARMLVRSGSTLLVPRNGRGHEDVSQEIAENGTMLLAPEFPPRKRVKVKVRGKGNKAAITAVSTKAVKGKAATTRSATAATSGRAVKLTGKAAARR
jgi:membrane-bound lytic murein transglycosylase D